MNDMMNDTTGDDAVIARLRSALDEVATTGAPITADTDTADTGTADTGTSGPGAPVIPLRTASPGRRPARTWIGVAAATVVLMGGAGWVLSQRTSPAATGADTTLESTPSLTDPTATPVTGTGDAPWYTVGLPDAVPGGISTSTVGNDAGGFRQSWIISGPNGDTSALGMLIIDVRYDELGSLPSDDNYTEIDAPQGTAWLLTDPGSLTSDSPELIWQRDDGTRWMVTQAGLIGAADADGSAFAEYVFQVQRGTFNDLLNNPDERAEWVGASPTGEVTEYKQNYAVGGSDKAIVLEVANYSTLSSLSEATGITETSVAGNRAWRGTQANGETTVVWGIDGSTIPATSSAAAQQWWGLLRISPALGDRVDEVLESVTPVAAKVGEPAPVQPTVVETTVPVAPTIATSTTVTLPPANATVRTDYPVFGITSARITPGAVEVTPAPDSGAIGSVWRLGGDEPTTAFDGLTMLTIDATAVDAATLTELGWSSVTELDGVAEGAAWLVDDASDDLGGKVGPRIYWVRPDGGTWIFSQVGVPATRLDDWADLVLTAVPGSGVPVVIPDDRAELLYLYGPWTTTVSQTFTDVGGGTATLTLWDSAWLLSRMDHAESVTKVEVDGRTGWREEYAVLGRVTVYWDAGNGWFAALQFDQGLADRADELIATNLVRLDS